MTSTTDQIRTLGARWAEAELGGDADALAALATDDFALVGPLGFVLDRDQWLDRYRAGDFATYDLSWEVTGLREYGDGTAVVLGVLDQRAAYRGTPADGRFRVTQIAVRAPDAWRLAGLHLSPLPG